MMYIGFFLRKFQMPQKIPFVLIVNLPLMKPNPAAVMFNFKAEQFEYFFSLFGCLQWNFIFLLFSRSQRFFDLPNIALGNNFHQINRRNLLILPRRRLGGGKPLCDTRFLSLYPTISFHLLDFSIFFSNEISWLFQYISDYVSSLLLINDAALSGNLQDNGKNPVASAQWNIAYGEMEIWK